MTIDPTSEKPIFLQIAEQLEDAIFTGIYPEGEKVPSTNEIAALLAPDSAKLDLDFTEGTLTMDLTEGNLSEIHLDCQGRVKVAVLEATAGLSADIVFTDAVLKLPKAVENSFR